VLAAGSTTAAPGIVWAVVGVALGAGLICLLFGVIFAFSERKEARSVREAARAVGGGRGRGPAKGAPQGGPVSPLAGKTAPPPTPVEEQAGLVDFGSLAQLATALAKLKVSATFLVMGLAFIAVATAAATAGIAVA
jgi:hypothetical protein